MKKDRELKNKAADLAKVREEIRTLSIKLSDMYRTPKYERSYSSAKIDSWEREKSKLEEREARLQSEINELSADPERLKEITARAMALNMRRTEIQIERDRLKDLYDDLRYSMGERVFMGGDPVALADELQVLKKRIEGFSNAIEAINFAQAYGAKLK